MAGFLERVIREIKGGKSLALSEFRGSSGVYLVSRIWTQLKRPTLVVLPSAEEAKTFLNDISNITKGEAVRNIHLLASPTILPYTHLIPEREVWIERSFVLYSLMSEGSPLVVASTADILRKTPPPEVFKEYTIQLRAGSSIDMDGLLEDLVSYGYTRSSLVEEEGEFAVRGSIVDVWSPVTDRPTRIEMDGNKIESIRQFDPFTQRSSFQTGSVEIIPVQSVVLDEKTKKGAFARLKHRSDERDIKPATRREYIETLANNLFHPATETLAPIFYHKMANIVDYLSPHSIVFQFSPLDIQNESSGLILKLENLYKGCESIERAVMPSELYLSYHEWEDALASKGLIIVDINGRSLNTQNQLELLTETDIPTRGSDLINRGLATGQDMPHRIPGEVGSLISYIETYRKTLKVVIACGDDAQSKRVEDILDWYGLAHTINHDPFNEEMEQGLFVSTADISTGFIWREEGILVITDSELFAKKRRRRPSFEKYEVEEFASYEDLSVGDLLVHKKYGIGKYLGMEEMEVDGVRCEFLKIGYSGEDKLYIPVYNLEEVKKYIGGRRILDRLGSTRWKRACANASFRARRLAKELIKLYAERKIAKGFSFKGRDQLMEEFEAMFPYEETPDQIKAIEDVLEDMKAANPMDRLICGDVGYGKTEVALRAAFVAVMDGKQVALLVPTTILALQHFRTFTERFKGTSVVVELLSRLKSKREQGDIIRRLKTGEINIVIGTHKLLQPGVKFHDLGLLIIDEEHKFGVRQKERIKRLKAEVDAISMSATPIPRTLHMALAGIRDISVINTPPANRLPIKTYIAEFSDAIVRDAVLKELARGGQIFFLHNRIETIDAMRRRLEGIVPEARMVVAHGKMDKKALEDTMVKFINREYDMLVATTIIESGLDIPSVNTLIVNRAENFGLAELYQIRGRVGRSGEQAYAYLLVPHLDSLTRVQAKRLSLLKKHTELGSGFKIAMHDLEIRGVGNILGEEQSGHIDEIGYELYTEMLEEEIRRLKGEGLPKRIETEIRVPIPAYIPQSYIRDEGLRLAFYKKMSSMKKEQDIEEIERELKDRFGEMPPEARNLVKIIGLKIEAERLWISYIQAGKDAVVYGFADGAPVNVDALLKYISINRNRIKLKGDSKILVKLGHKGVVRLFEEIRHQLNEFQVFIEKEN